MFSLDGGVFFDFFLDFVSVDVLRAGVISGWVFVSVVFHLLGVNLWVYVVYAAGVLFGPACCKQQQLVPELLQKRHHNNDNIALYFSETSTQEVLLGIRGETAFQTVLPDSAIL